VKGADWAPFLKGGDNMDFFKRLKSLTNTRDKLIKKMLNGHITLPEVATLGKAIQEMCELYEQRVKAIEEEAAINLNTVSQIEEVFTLYQSFVDEKGLRDEFIEFAERR
jgi:uncharacterized protein (UPF0305 family)